MAFAILLSSGTTMKLLRARSVRYITMEHSIFLMFILAAACRTSANLVFQETNQLMGEKVEKKVPKPADLGLEELSSLPEQKDWRDDNYVTPVKNQGQCAACWAFTAVAAMEAQLRNKTNTLYTLSEQNIVDCARSYNNEGCSAGWVNRAFEYMRDHGIETNATYLYKERKQDCLFDENNSVGKLINYVKIKNTNETEIMKIVAKHGPVSVHVYMSDAFLSYNDDSIFDDPNYNNEIPDHAVTIVGYVNNDKERYWIIKNSFGTSWGHGGYMKMIMFKNLLRVTERVFYPIV
ncbi:procathepsin L-like [Rhincodon typus]|uniref:procathepsin L-like n=1 Tax=Rhincodon typus TaxID=259920 RepID=UPI0009A33B32|nr:procathepsin L-like [Rhincodon typus]